MHECAYDPVCRLRSVDPSGCPFYQYDGLDEPTNLRAGAVGDQCFVLVVHRYAILLLRLRYHTKQYSTINIIQKATYLIIAVALVVWLRDYYFYILAVSTILSTLIATVCALLLEKEVWDFRALSRENWIPQKELLSYSIPIMFSSGITMISTPWTSCS